LRVYKTVREVVVVVVVISDNDRDLYDSSLAFSYFGIPCEFTFNFMLTWQTWLQEHVKSKGGGGSEWGTSMAN